MLNAQNDRSFVLLAQLPSKQPAIFGKIDLRLLLLMAGQPTLPYWDKLRGGYDSDVNNIVYCNLHLPKEFKANVYYCIYI